MFEKLNIRNIFDKDKFFQARAHLLQTEPFYALMASQCNAMITDKIKTISIREEKGALYIAYNTKWVQSQPVEKVAEAIKHVLNHLIFGHLGNGNFPNEDKSMEIAKDLAINSYLNKKLLPEGFLTPEDFNLPREKSTMEYYDLLPHQEEEQPDKQGPKIKGGGNGEGKGQQGEKEGGGGGSGGEGDGQGDGKGQNQSDYEKPGDDHDFMKSESSESQMEQAVSNMVQNAHNRSGGRLPSSYGSQILDLIKIMLMPSEIPWQQILRNFIAFSAKTKKERTWKRLNRRFGDLQRGTRKKQLLKVLVGVDESGSVGDKEWELFWSEIDSIHKNGDVEIIVAKFTTRIEKVFTFTKIDDVALTRYSGGTLFQPLWDLAEAEKPDCVICFTDGFNADQPSKYSRPYSVLWGLVPNGEQQEKFGTAIKIKDNTKQNKRLVY